MASNKKSSKAKRLLVGALAVFVIGIVAGVGMMTLVSHFKQIKSDAPEKKVEETKIKEEFTVESSDGGEISQEQLTTDIVMDEDEDEDGDGNSTIHGTFDAYFKSCDWGAQLLRTVIKLDAPIDRAKASDWVVTERVSGYEHHSEVKKITDAFLCDAKGERIDKPSKYIVLEFYTAPTEQAPYCWNSELNHYEYPDLDEDGYEVDIELNEDSDLTSKNIEIEDIEIDDTPVNIHSGVDGFKQDTFESTDGIEYTYAHYEAPKGDTLVVFLHGLSEGGDDADALLTAALTNCAMMLGDDFQNTMGGASILIPHCPTYWMNQSPTYDSLEWATYNPYIQSWYTQSLHELITYYKQECGAKRVIIAGHSNGGFMTLLLALYYENEYDGYVCLSEAMWDKSLTDEHITNLAKLPIYFIYCNADQSAPPGEYSAPTIQRIKSKRPKNLHVSTFDEVADITGTYFDDDGTSYTFDAHQSQIYFFRNNCKCNDCGKSVWDWMATVGR